MVQTFLPFESYEQSASCLDNKRVNSCCFESHQILSALETGKGWIHHPATKQWKGYEVALAQYGIVMCIEKTKRPRKDGTCLEQHAYLEYFQERGQGECIMPPWLGDERFHSSHRAALLEKNFEWYSRFGWKEKPEKRYFWPSKEGY